MKLSEAIQRLQSALDDLALIEGELHNGQRDKPWEHRNGYQVAHAIKAQTMTRRLRESLERRQYAQGDKEVARS